MFIFLAKIQRIIVLSTKLCVFLYLLCYFLFFDYSDMIIGVQTRPTG